MYEKILNKYCRIIKNVNLSIFATKISIFILDLIFFLRYFLAINSKKINACKIDCEINEKKYKNIFPLERIEICNYDLSIIIPAYNCEGSIKECLESIFQQKTEYSYEVIVINDGSTDRTLEKINEFSYINITVISQENRGIAVARNSGVNIATGKYIMFCDADDSLTDGSIEILLKEAFKENLDIVEGNYYNFYNENDKVIGKPTWNRDFNIDLSVNKEFIYTIKGFPWGRIYSRKLWFNVEFPVGFDFEDTVIKYTIFRKANNFKYVNKIIYNYKISSNSITNKIQGSMKSLDTFFIIPYLINLNKDINLNFDETFYRIILNQCSTLLYYRTNGLDEKIIDYILSEVKKLLLEFDIYSKNLNMKDRLLKKAILDENKKRWILCCKSR